MEHKFPDGSTSLQSSKAVKQDAIMMNFRPGNIVITSDASTVQVASWPYHGDAVEDKADDGSIEMYRRALVKIRKVPGDATSLTEVNYYSLIRMLEVGDLS